MSKLSLRYTTAIMKRNELKKIHADFDAMYSRIQTMHLTCPESTRDYVRGGIVLLLSKMFMDIVLRKKLFEKGLSMLMRRWASFLNPSS